jgi:hypothetical protein
LFLIAPLAFAGCATNGTDSTADGTDDGKADGGSSGTYFSCTGLGTNNTVWIDIFKKSVVVTVEGAGVNTGKLTTSDSSSKTFSDWTSKTFFGAGDTLVIPNSLMTDGSGKVSWYMANVNPYWEGTCTQEKPTGDQCMPLVEDIYPVDSNATAKYTTVSSGHYTVHIPDTKVGAFDYAITMHKSGILCTYGDTTPTSCSAIVADAIGSKAIKDGSSSGSPYVDSKSGTTWTGGVHDAESGEFAYTVTTDSTSDGCTVTSIKTN